MTGTDSEGHGGPCRSCGTELRHVFTDLGMSPLCESYVAVEDANRMEPFYPLRVYTCHECYLVQLQEYVSPAEIFTEYAYFSAYSTAWLKHAEDYTEMISARLGLGPESFVVELASNDGYLLQYFVQQGVPVLGIDPAANVAKDAEARGVPTLVEFFDAGVAKGLVASGPRADLIAANNVLAQVTDLHGFVEGIRVLLAEDGVATLEFPHLVRLMDENQFDTIYHEHFSYFSLVALDRMLAAHKLEAFDVDELWTHGGSLRVYAGHAGAHALTDRVTELRAREVAAGLTDIATYGAFDEQVRETKRKLLEFLIEAKRAGKSIAGYGAPGKGNTLLNYCGIRTDFLDYTVDRNPYKQGRLLPGTHIPIHPPERIDATRPDYVLILPWNLRDEITAQMAHIREWGGRFVVPIPAVGVTP